MSWQQSVAIGNQPAGMWYLRCDTDGCNSTTPRALKRKTWVRLAARQLGWRTTVAGKHFCPLCEDHR